MSDDSARQFEDVGRGFVSAAMEAGLPKERLSLLKKGWRIPKGNDERHRIEVSSKGVVYVDGRRANFLAPISPSDAVKVLRRYLTTDVI